MYVVVALLFPLPLTKPKPVFCSVAIHTLLRKTDIIFVCKTSDGLVSPYLYFFLLSLMDINLFLLFPGNPFSIFWMAFLSGFSVGNLSLSFSRLHSCFRCLPRLPAECPSFPFSVSCGLSLESVLSVDSCVMTLLLLPVSSVSQEQNHLTHCSLASPAKLSSPFV